ncbi:MAG: hypothetical protein V1870_01070 [Candidatus Aenigmatarchaeota archaeon]
MKDREVLDFLNRLTCAPGFRKLSRIVQSDIISIRSRIMYEMTGKKPWKYVCIACKKYKKDTPESSQYCDKNIKRLDSSYDRKKRIVYCICVKCLKKGKILGDFFDEYKFKGMERGRKDIVKWMNSKK